VDFKLVELGAIFAKFIAMTYMRLLRLNRKTEVIEVKPKYNF
jgi:hypothetical protein